MLNTQEFGDFLHSVGLKDFVGVPCSYLSPLINYAINENHFIMSNNEGDAVAIASGISLGHLACGDFFGSSSPNSLRRMSNTPHSLNSHSSKNSSAILECQAESSQKDSKAISESRIPDSNVNTESPHATYGIVLMQNSGLSNALSPITSLNHTFKIPILGFVSLRGERDCHGKNTDEPQHELLGIITDKLLETCQVPYAFLDSDIDRAKSQVAEALEIMSRGESFFFIVRDKTFSKVKLVDSNSRHSACSEINSSLGSHSQGGGIVQSNTANTRITDSQVQDSRANSESTASDSHSILETTSHTSIESPTDSINTSKSLPTRLNALECIHALALKYQALLLATTGKCGRELYEINDTPNQLYMVGSMGCVSALSLGLSLASKQKVIAIDGDSALLMRLGTLSTNAYYTRGNFCHILLDNESHDSTGGQFNLSPFVSFTSIAMACGYTHVYEARSIDELGLALKEFLSDGHLACGDFFGSSSPNSLRRMSNTPHSLNSHSSKNSSAILECQAESSQKDSKAISESTLSDSHPLSESKPNSYFIYLKIAKGSKENLGRPKITPQDVAKRLSAYMQKWRQNHTQVESSQILADTQALQKGDRDLQNTTQNRACGKAQDLQKQNSHTSHTKEQK